jgi:hypothetical protein
MLTNVNIEALREQKARAWVVTMSQEFDPSRQGSIFGQDDSAISIEGIRVIWIDFLIDMIRNLFKGMSLFESYTSKELERDI